MGIFTVIFIYVLAILFSNVTAVTFQDTLTALHNNVRQKISRGKEQCFGGPCPLPQSELPDLIWDNALAQVAVEYVQHCIYRHDDGFKAYRAWQFKCNSIYVHDCPGKELSERHRAEKLGENMYRKGGLRTQLEDANEAVYLWDAESTRYNWENPPVVEREKGGLKINNHGRGAIGHWSQITHEETRYFGCGWNFCKKEGFSLLACKYYPSQRTIKLPDADIVRPYIPSVASGESAAEAKRKRKRKRVVKSTGSKVESKKKSKKKSPPQKPPPPQISRKPVLKAKQKKKSRSKKVTSTSSRDQPKFEFWDPKRPYSAPHLQSHDFLSSRDQPKIMRRVEALPDLRSAATQSKTRRKPPVTSTSMHSKIRGKPPKKPRQISPDSPDLLSSAEVKTKRKRKKKLPGPRVPPAKTAPDLPDDVMDPKSPRRKSPRKQPPADPFTAKAKRSDGSLQYDNMIQESHETIWTNYSKYTQYTVFIFVLILACFICAIFGFGVGIIYGCIALNYRKECTVDMIGSIFE